MFFSPALFNSRAGYWGTVKVRSKKRKQTKEKEIEKVSKLWCSTSPNWFFEMMKLLPVFQRTQEEHKEENDEDSHHLQRVTAILELLQYKINIEEPHRLLPTLFATLTRYIIHSQS